jgi:hypothetical protein
MAIIKKTRNDKCWQGWGGKGTLNATVRKVNWYSQYGKQYLKKLKIKNYIKKLKKLKLQLPHDQQSLSGYIPRGNKTSIVEM